MQRREFLKKVARNSAGLLAGDFLLSQITASAQTNEPPTSTNVNRMKHSSFRPGELWQDNNGTHINAHGGGILFHDAVYYWFGEHKVEGEAGNRAQVGVHVYSSRDLYNWRDEGVALSVSDDPKSPIVRGCILERPKVIFNPRTKKFVMWFHLEPKGAGYAGAFSGVATADKVIGPYEFLRCFRPNAGVWPLNVPDTDKRPLSKDELSRLGEMELAGGPRPWYPKQLLFRRDFAVGQMARDMTLFVDDDGSAYHIYASEANGTLHISQLSDDFLSPAGKYIRVLPGRFNEAPAMLKWRGRYFLFTSGCTGWAPNPARLLAADSIFGNWEELGNPCLGTGAQIACAFQSQSSFIMPVRDKRDAFIFMADRWNPKNAIDGRYVWLPIDFKHGVPTISWHDEWDLSFFGKQR
jgi:Glycosyl hydrolases family 43